VLDEHGLVDRVVEAAVVDDLQSPASASAGSRDLVPTTLPSATATTTNASHPKIAVLRWDALQRPMRAARF
jgi:hypothetical protein